MTTTCVRRFPIAAHAAAALPPLTTAALRECRRPKRPFRPLSSCLHLSNPATGSTSLSDAFRTEPSLRNVTLGGRSGPSVLRSDLFRSQTGTHGFDLMHSHAFGVAELQSYLAYKRLPAARCFVMSLRDPAARLMSGFRDSYVHAERMSVALGARKNRTASQLVERLRNLFDYPQRPLPHEVAHRNASAVAYLYHHSAGQARWLYNWHYPGPIDGSMFLTSQLGYLRGVDCAADEVHFICQERFDEDWRALFAAKQPGHAGDAIAQPRQWHSHRRNDNASRSAMQRFAQRRALLSDEEQAFVRRELYPWDTALHRAVCAGDAAPADDAPLDEQQRFVDWACEAPAGGLHSTGGGTGSLAEPDAQIVQKQIKSRLELEVGSLAL